MTELNRAEIIKQEKASEISFMQEANAARGQAERFNAQAEEYDECARIAREKWTQLESEND